MSTLGLVGTAILGGLTGARFYQHKSQENTRKNLLGQAYGLAQKQLATRQRQVRENENEGLVARGMMQGGQASNTIGGQSQADTETQLGLERSDLALQQKEALAGIKADYTNQTMGDVVGSISDAVRFAGAANGLSAMRAMGSGSAAAPSSGVAGAFGLDPLHATPQVGSPGTPNYDFSVPAAMGY